MNRFVQFIFVMLFSGILMAMLIVYTFSQRSERHKKMELAQAQERVRGALDQIQRQSRRGDLAVEWQRISSDGRIIETSLLWQPHNVNKDLALPIQHFLIPGDQVNIDGVAFRFTGDFSPDVAYLKGRTICVLNSIFGQDQKAAGRAHLSPPHVAPTTLLVDPQHPTLLEKQLWQRIWDLYVDRDIKHLDAGGLEIVEIPAATHQLERGKLYHVWIGRNVGNGSNLGIDIDEDKDRDSTELLRRAVADTQEAG